MSDPGGAVTHGVMAENEGGPGGQLVPPASFTGADTEARLDLSRISQQSLPHFVVARLTMYLMFAGDVGNILMDSLITEFK